MGPVEDFCMTAKVTLYLFHIEEGNGGAKTDMMWCFLLLGVVYLTIEVISKVVM